MCASSSSRRKTSASSGSLAPPSRAPTRRPTRESSAPFPPERATLLATPCSSTPPRRSPWPPATSHAHARRGRAPRSRGERRATRSSAGRSRRVAPASRSKGRASREPAGGHPRREALRGRSTRTPDAGPLSRALAPGERALAYAEAGAAMVSVLCDAQFFDGAWEHVTAARARLDRAERRVPVLAKEFVVDERQIEEALDRGADAVLLIARIVSPARLVQLARAALQMGIEPLVGS